MLDLINDKNLSSGVQDLLERAEIMLEQADKIDSRAFVTSKVRFIPVHSRYIWAHPSPS